VTGSLPPDVQEVFGRFKTTEYTTIDARGRPITWPVTPYYERGGECIDVTTGLGYPKKANDARANPMVALLFSDPTGSGLGDPPTVLVQGVAEVDDRDLEANRRRYERESVEKLPGIRGLQPPGLLKRLAPWYFTRIYVHVRPERVYVWRRGLADPPELFDSRVEEVRSGHYEAPAAAREPPTGGSAAWDERMAELGERYETAVLSLLAPDGFPFSLRAPVTVDTKARRVRIDAESAGAPMQPGLACLTAHDHEPTLRWQRNFQVRGDLVRDERGWALVPHRLVGGFEAPPGSRLALVRRNLRKAARFHATALRELRRRRSRPG
jgi:hypothetical protein